VPAGRYRFVQTMRDSSGHRRAFPSDVTVSLQKMTYRTSEQRLFGSDHETFGLPNTFSAFTVGTTLTADENGIQPGWGPDSTPEIRYVQSQIHIQHVFRLAYEALRAAGYGTVAFPGRSEGWRSMPL